MQLGADFFVTLLLQALQNQSLDRTVKPPVIAAFGNIALAINVHFHKYMQVVMTMLASAASTVVPDDDEEGVEYKYELWTNIIDAYQGIINGHIEAIAAAQQGAGAAALAPTASGILGFLGNVAQDSESESHPELSRSIIALAADMAKHLGAQMTPMLQPHLAWLHKAKQNAMSDEPDQSAQETVQYAVEHLGKIGVQI